VTVLELYVLPAIFKNGAFIVQADKEDFRSPAKAIADMDRGGFTAGHFGLAAGADMDFVKITEITGKHMYFS
jgi:hypothetical protein